MEIKRITPFNIKNNIDFKMQKPAVNLTALPQSPNRESIGKLPSTAQYLSFRGGYSLNLSQTIKGLDKLAEKESSVYPKHIREWAGMILEGGNKAKETLIDIHKKYYEALKSCTTLEQAKSKFPEFSDVLPDNAVGYSKNSFGYVVKNGLLECFDKDEDLSLQILKLYYGEGFSLNDLKQYAGGKDIYYTMKKLNIPTLNKDYGHILKFSDPEYNERLTAEMTFKRRLTLDKKAMEETGDPVYIPRGPLSKEHRQHISEGLLKYHAEHPEKVFEMSERQKQFYEENPEKAAIFKRVMNKAWGVGGADRIKKALSDFMKGKGFKDFKANELDNPLSINGAKSKTIKQFWGANEWAKKAFSKNMEYAWKKVKEENEMSYILDVTPSGYKNKFFKWAKEQGINTEDLKFEVTYYPHKSEMNNLDKSKLSVYTRRFSDEAVDDEPSKMADSYVMALFNTNKELSKINLSKVSKEQRELVEYMKMHIRGSVMENSLLPLRMTNFKVLDTQEAQKAYVVLLQECMDRHNTKFVDMLNKHLNESYDKLDNGWNPGRGINPYDYFTD